jgi:hypothetical protein
MNRYTENEIYKMFRDVIPNRANFLRYYKGSDTISLDGSFSIKDLYNIIGVMDKITEFDKEVNRIKELEVKGFKVKDIKVIWSCGGKRDRKSDKEYTYSFYVMKDGKDWDFYYGGSDQGAGDWWPEPTEEGYLSPLTNFIPTGFAEACENMYEYRRTKEEALNLLQECGFTVEKGDDL